MQIYECRFCHTDAGFHSSICKSCKGKLLLIGVFVFLFVIALSGGHIV